MSMREFVPIIVGAVIGAFAHFGRIVTDNGMPPLRMIVGFLMQLGFIILLAALVTEQLKIESDLWKSMTAASLALSVREIIPWMKTRAKNVTEGFGFRL